MNKIIKGSIALVAFAIAIGIFQMCSKENVIAQAASYVLPIATPSVLGGVKPDGTTILVDATGKISTAGTTATLPIATATTLGGVKPDGTTITVDATGKISSAALQQQGKIIYSIMTGFNFGSLSQVWIANFDGTNKTQVPLTGLPSNIEFLFPAKISPDGKTVFLIGHIPGSNPTITQIYSMSTSGSNVVKIAEITGTGNISDAVITDIQLF